MEVFSPFICRQLQSCARHCLGCLRGNTLKTLVRRKRGPRIRRRVLSDSKIPGNWHSFLRINENTEELLKLLEVEVSEIQTKGSCIHLWDHPFSTYTVRGEGGVYKCVRLRTWGRGGGSRCSYVRKKKVLQPQKRKNNRTVSHSNPNLPRFVLVPN